jgi:REP element-mobilizing transposase RayT
MVLSEVGEMVRKTLKEVTNKFEDSEIPHYVIMPNHIHLII